MPLTKLPNGKIQPGRLLLVMSIIMIVSGVFFFFDDFRYFFILDELVADGHMQSIIDFSGIGFDGAVTAYYSSLVEGCVQSVLMVISGILGFRMAWGKGNRMACQIMTIITLSLAILIFITIGFIFGFENMAIESYIVNLAIIGVFLYAVRRESNSHYWVELERSGMQTVSEILHAENLSTSSCTITIRPKSIKGTLAIPLATTNDYFMGEDDALDSDLMLASFKITDEKLEFQTDDQLFENLLDEFRVYLEKEQEDMEVDLTPLDELLVFLYFIISDDSLLLSNWRDSLHILENIVNSPKKDIPHDFEVYISNARNELYTLERFYQQVVQLCQTVSVSPLIKISDIARSQFAVLGSRAEVLAQEADQTAEYAMQIRELRESRTEAKQTEISTVLTVVATVCMSVSLVTGWYGMNFANMPELQNRLSYMVIIIICIIMVTAEIVYFKRKKWF